MFKYYLPGNTVFVCKDGFAWVQHIDDLTHSKTFCYELKPGMNYIAELKISICIGECDISSSNVYKMSTQQIFNSAIIGNRLCVRSRVDGDVCEYGGITHKIKRIMNDNKIPTQLRDKIPLICDENGVIWIPNLAKRTEKRKTKEDFKLSIYYDEDSLIYIP
jgi:tRNA(Ile)-lysidine synthase